MRNLQLILFFLFLSTHFSFGQSDIEHEKEIKSYLLSRLDAVGNCFLKKDYQQAIDSIAEIEKYYLNLDVKLQERYIDVPQNCYYNLACAYAMLEKPELALNAFRSAVDHGYANYNDTKNDPDLKILRSMDEFQVLMDVIKSRGDYVFILKQAGKYIQERPVFKYQDSSDPELIKLSKTFNLDSIAGNGNDITRILNLMKWVHNLIVHDGSFMPPVESRTALSLYEYVSEHKTGMNCRAMAIFLNECYLSLGFKSRYVTCMPKDANDMDCHVINTVYSTSLGKWIWVDPTLNACVYDENNTMLGIAEVRKRIIDDMPVFINEDANWNNKTPYTKERYIDNYMAKNLYWLTCPVESKVNSDKMYNYNNFVSLVPLNFYPAHLDSSIYYSHDEDYFWEN